MNSADWWMGVEEGEEKERKGEGEGGKNKKKEQFIRSCP